MASPAAPDDAYTPCNKNSNLHCPICFENQFFTSWRDHCMSATHITAVQMFDDYFLRKGNRVRCKMCSSEFEWTMLNEHSKLHLLQPWYRPLDLYKRLFDNHMVLWRKQYYCCLCRINFPNWYVAKLHFGKNDHKHFQKMASLMISSSAPPIKPHLYEVLVKEGLTPLDGYTVRCTICKVEKIDVTRTHDHVSSFYHWHFSTKFGPELSEKPTLGECADCWYFQEYGKNHFICAVCDSLVLALRDKTEIHLQGNAHVNSLKKYSCDKITLKSSNKYHCGYCYTCVEGPAELYRHIKSKSHGHAARMAEQQKTETIKERVKLLRIVMPPASAFDVVCRATATIERVPGPTLDAFSENSEEIQTSATTVSASESINEPACAIVTVGTVSPASESISEHTCAIETVETAAPASESISENTCSTGRVEIAAPDSESLNDHTYAAKNAAATAPTSKKSNKGTRGRKIAPTSAPALKIVENTSNDCTAKLDAASMYCKFCKIESFGDRAITNHARSDSHAATMMKYGCDMISRLEEKVFHCKCCDCMISGYENVSHHMMGKRHMNNLDDSRRLQKDKTSNSCNLNINGTQQEDETPNSCNVNNSRQPEEDQTSNSCNLTDSREPEEDRTSNSCELNNSRKQEEDQSPNVCNLNDSRNPEEDETPNSHNLNDSRNPEEDRTPNSCNLNDSRKPEEDQTPNSHNPNDSRKSEGGQISNSCNSNDSRKPEEDQTPNSHNPNDSRKSEGGQIPNSCNSNDSRKPEEDLTPNSHNPNDRKPEEDQTPNSHNPNDSRQSEGDQTPNSCNLNDSKIPEEDKTPNPCHSNDSKKPEEDLTPNSHNPNDNGKSEGDQTPNSCNLNDSKIPEEDKTPNPCHSNDSRNPEEDKTPNPCNLNDSRKPEEGQTPNSHNPNDSRRSDGDQTTNSCNLKDSRKAKEDQTPNSCNLNDSRNPEEDKTPNPCNLNDSRKPEESQTPNSQNPNDSRKPEEGQTPNSHNPNDSRRSEGDQTTNACNLKDSRKAKEDQTPNSCNLNDSRNPEEDKTPNPCNLNDSRKPEESQTPNSHNPNDSRRSDGDQTTNSCNLKDSRKAKEDQTPNSCNLDDSRNPEEDKTPNPCNLNDSRKPQESQTPNSQNPNDSRKPEEGQIPNSHNPNDSRRSEGDQITNSCNLKDSRKAKEDQTPNSCNLNDSRNPEEDKTPNPCNLNDSRKPEEGQTPNSYNPNDSRRSEGDQTTNSCNFKDSRKAKKDQTPNSCNLNDSKIPEEDKTPNPCHSNDSRNPEEDKTPNPCNLNDSRKPEEGQTPNSHNPNDSRRSEGDETTNSCNLKDSRNPKEDQTPNSCNLNDSRKEDQTPKSHSANDSRKSEGDQTLNSCYLNDNRKPEEDKTPNSHNPNDSEKQQEDRTANPCNLNNSKAQQEDHTPKNSEKEAKPEQLAPSKTSDPNNSKKQREEHTEKNIMEATKINRSEWTKSLSLMIEEFAQLEKQLKLKSNARKHSLEMPLVNQPVVNVSNDPPCNDCNIVRSTSASLYNCVAGRFTPDSSLSQKDKDTDIRINSYLGKHQVENNDIAAAWKPVPCKMEPFEPTTDSYRSFAKPSIDESTDSNVNFLDVKSELSMSFSIASLNSSDDERSSILTTDSQRKRRLPKRMMMQRIVRLLDFDKDCIYDMKDKLKEIELGTKLCIVRESKSVYCLVCRKTIADEPQTYVEHLCSSSHSQYIELMQKDHSLFENVTGQFSDLDLASQYMAEISEENLACLVCRTDVPNEDFEIEEHVKDRDHESACEKMRINRKQKFEEIKSLIQSDWYKVQRYQCVPCSANFDSNVNFVKHLESKKHTIVVNKCENVVRTMIYDYCAPCALLWYGYRCTYAEHCNAPAHKWRLRDGHYPLQPLPELAKNLLRMPEEFVEDTINYLDGLAVKEREKEETVVQDLERAVKSKFFNAKAYVFGSRTYGLYSPDSNIDVFLDCGTNYDGYVKSECLVQNLMTVVHQCLSKDSQTWDMSELLSECRSLVVRATHRATGLSCEISLESGLPVENSMLIKSFVDVFPPCRRLMLFLMQWLDSCNLSGLERISSHALCWLVIFYLQKETILPSIAALIAMNSKSRVIAGWEVGVSHKFTYREAVGNYSLKDFLRRFFTFYADFDFRYYVACPLLGREVRKRAFGKHKQLPEEMAPYIAYIENSGDPEPLRIDSPMCVQDPFDLQHNLTKTVSKVLLCHFRTCCSKSLGVL